MSAETQPQDAARRRRRGAERAPPALSAQPPVQPQSPFAALDLVSQDELEIHPPGRPHGFEGDRHRLPARRRARSAEGRGRRRRSGLEARAFRSRPGRGADRARAYGIRPARAQRSPQSRDRRAACRLRRGRQRAQRLRSRRRAQAREHRRLSQLPPSRADVRFEFTSRAAIRSSRSTSTPPSAISTLCSTC